MPRPESDPPIDHHWRRYRRLLAAMFGLACATVVVAIVWLRAGGTPLSPHFLIAMGLGIVLSLMLAAALMGLVFVSARNGTDDAGLGDAPRTGHTDD